MTTFPRILFAAVNSGGGKTTITCGVLKALCDRGMKLSAFKCGPDYIDPLFHREMIGAKSSNLDLFFTEEEVTKGLFAKQAMESDLSIIEGVMGYYDGLGGTTTEASAYHLAKTLDCPVVLVVDGKGSSISICAQIQGFQKFREQSNIVGVILNKCNPMLTTMLTPIIEEECQVKVLGCLPYDESYGLESRHLGLVTAGEIETLQEKLKSLSTAVEQYIQLDALIELANKAPEISYQLPEIIKATIGKPKIGVARDKAFCFYYQESLTLLEELGAELIEFSPLTDTKLPGGVSALYIGGGYPELYLPQLAGNNEMKESIYQAVQKGMPTLAECGGFMYLTEGIEGYPMVGALKGHCENKGKLGRFGYITLSAQADNMLCKAGESIPAHEFHYYDCDENGAAFQAKKPVGTRAWEAGYARESMVAGFPHLYLYGNIEFAKQFVKRAEAYQKER